MTSMFTLLLKENLLLLLLTLSDVKEGYILKHLILYTVGNRPAWFQKL